MTNMVVTPLLFDEGPGAGLGHRRRMEVLARALHERGHACHLAPLDATGPVHAPLVVVDSYRARADELDVDADVVVAVDDLYRDLAVDVVVDPSPGADARRHARAGRVFAGATYALVSPPQPAATLVPADGPVPRVLVTTGAADAAGVGARVAGSLRSALPGTEIRLVVGRWGAPDVPDGVTAVHAPPSLADELATAPVVVTAGGVSMLEACLLGRAVVAVIVAENQRCAVEALAAEGAVVVAGIDGAADAARTLVSDPGRRAALAAAAARALDGRGAERLAQELVP